ncbi:MAG: hypothetical protein KKB50_16490 [Planctomycetes bacterium]|nr:hypothetical protein [Planctomycetota bacterium]
MRLSGLEFDRTLFVRAFAGALAVAAVGVAVVIRVYGSITPIDVSSMLACVPLVA